MTTVPPTAFVVDEQLCFALYAASRAMSAAYRPGLAALGLTYTQYLVLLVLWEDGPIPLGAVCQRLGLDSATVSPLVRRLESKGLVTRRRLTSDERVVEVSTTAEGDALYDRAGAVQREVEAATGLAGRELAVLREELHQLTRRLETHTTRRASADDGAGDQPGAA
ncbi:MarR family winged helix-turn-helix transcriptional regulator [Euzebya tangerina]|uniref:MarR family winged helix-turn-helix transcriptional regulator n=1 Tax=Euzebya tangerina TaxID=591198 RepID=UPI000E31452C|nr:MarR family transcriptional regulator [Euzebya tangerina]